MIEKEKETEDGMEAQRRWEAIFTACNARGLWPVWGLVTSPDRQLRSHVVSPSSFHPRARFMCVPVFELGMYKDVLN
jgi:hypothetical protein